ncbi:MAG: hypothetical protein ASARMPREDX12_003946 [Alectoria sarmentosa]|nr:MAG: hypothetical protein ASARMPREDX12_003946 [Alectoria sarmentosa]CAD6588924.1 MAG: hypothetical protein ASARMPRED_003833 [Alectoria sarmentosa]
MRPFQLLRNSPYLRSALQQTFKPASQAPPNQPFLLLNLLTRTTGRPPISNLLTRGSRRNPFSAHTSRRPYSTKPQKSPYNPTPSLNSPTSSLSLSQRLRKLSREYGWSAFGVYMLLSALDFPFCFAAVRYLGTDRIGHYEHVIIEWVKSVVPEPVREAWRKRMPGQEVKEDNAALAVGGMAGEETKVEGYAVVKGDSEVGVAGYDHGVKQAEKRNESENASIWTQLALAYAIHKTFIFIRVPFTVAVTPKVVKVLRGWGWDIGKRRPKGAR